MRQRMPPTAFPARCRPDGHMSEPALKRTVVVANLAGLHARAAVMVVTEARKFKARVIISKGTARGRGNGRIADDVAGGGAGEELVAGRCPATMPQAAVDAVEQLFLRKFDEE